MPFKGKNHDFNITLPDSYPNNLDISLIHMRPRSLFDYEQ